LLLDDVPVGVKQQRNNELLAIQNAISEQDHAQFVGRQFEVLVEGPSKKQLKNGAQEVGSLQLMGRTHCDRIVVFDGQTRHIGQFVPVMIHDASAHTLFGAMPEPDKSSELAPLLRVLG
jgi:tRNA-2-methylthio-N6-dimethylallyladenosine synthase